MSARIGFQARMPVMYRIYNVILASILLLCLSPVLLLLSFLLLITQGPKILYLGPRLGLGRRRFLIVKFRTLCLRRAAAMTSNRTLPENSNIETPLGKFLRETRLDEIPQLLNIIRGDMNICGPRPVRPEIAAIEAAHIKNYDLRFQVRPGLIGPAQACIGHGASKRIRARMNNVAVRRPVSITAELTLLLRIGGAILERVGHKAFGILRRFFSRKAPQCRNIWFEDAISRNPCLVRHVTGETLVLEDFGSSAGGQLIIRLRSGALRRARIKLGATGKTDVFTYTPLTDLDAFIVDRYALGRVIIQPDATLVFRAKSARAMPAAQSTP